MIPIHQKRRHNFLLKVLSGCLLCALVCLDTSCKKQTPNPSPKSPQYRPIRPTPPPPPPPAQKFTLPPARTKPTKTPRARPTKPIARYPWRKTWAKKPWLSATKQREKSILKAISWMESFIKRRWSYTSLGLDAIYIFLELSATSSSTKIRTQSRKAALWIAQKMKRYYLIPKNTESAGDLLDALDLLAELPTLKISPEPLLQKAKRRFATLRNDREVYQAPLKRLNSLNADKFFDVMINAYILEKVNITYNNAFPTKFKLIHALRHLRKWRYIRHFQDTSKNQEKFTDHAFLATHVALVLNNYGRLRLHKTDMPVVLPYLRKEFPHVLKIEDIELVAEFIDVFRGINLNDKNDAMIQAGTRFLLKTQNADGSWGKWQIHKDPYDAIHETWCAVLGLRDRVFLKDTPFHRRIRSIIRKLNKNN